LTSTKPLSKRAEKERDREEARAILLRMLQPGSKVYSIVRSVSRSGMSRTIDFYTITGGDGYPRDLTYLTGWIAQVLDYKRDDRGALKVGGCGMDMCFHVVYSLGQALWPNGTAEPHSTRNGSPDNAGGYALKSEHL
jgi:hypothetical protein